MSLQPSKSNISPSPRIRSAASIPTTTASHSSLVEQHPDNRFTSTIANQNGKSCPSPLLQSASTPHLSPIFSAHHPNALNLLLLSLARCHHIPVLLLSRRHHRYKRSSNYKVHRSRRVKNLPPHLRLWSASRARYQSAARIVPGHLCGRPQWSGVLARRGSLWEAGKGLHQRWSKSGIARVRGYNWSMRKITCIHFVRVTA